MDESNNKISVAIDQLKKEMKSLTLGRNSGNCCIEADTNVANNITNFTEDPIDAPKNVVKQEKGKVILNSFQL